MPKKRGILKKRVLVLPEWCITYFETGDTGHGVDFFAYCTAKGEKLDQLWSIYRENILTEWIKENPCTRPWYWWRGPDSPKELVPGCNGSEYTAYQAIRQRLGGTGKADYECLNVVPYHDYGIPSGFISTEEAEFFDTLSLTDAYDPEDPPVYESQAAYLDRHGLLTADEKRHLKKHPELLEPEAVIFEDEDAEDDEPASHKSAHMLQIPHG